MKCFLICSLMILSVNLMGQNQGNPYSFHKGDVLYVQAVSGLNMREIAAPGANVVASLPYGSKLTVIKRSNKALELKDFGGFRIYDSWYEVSYNNKRGFVFGGYLSRLPGFTASDSLYASISVYLEQHFTLIHTIQHKVSEKEEETNSCHQSKFYKEGITETWENCHPQVASISYIFLDARMSDVLSSLTKVLQAQGGIDELEYDRERNEVRMHYDLCYYTVRRIGIMGIQILADCG